MDDDKLTTERRRPERRALEGEVVISFDSPTLIGPGQNISAQGVFFVTDGTLPVRVRVEGQDVDVAGEVVRVESMGDGKLGVAVRFSDPVDA